MACVSVFICLFACFVCRDSLDKNWPWIKKGLSLLSFRAVIGLVTRVASSYLITRVLLHWCPTRPHGFGCLPAFHIWFALHVSHVSLRNPPHKIYTRSDFHLFRTNAGTTQNGPSQYLWTMKSLNLLQQNFEGFPDSQVLATSRNWCEYRISPNWCLCILRLQPGAPTSSVIWCVSWLHLKLV